MRLALESCVVDLDRLEIERAAGVQPLTPAEARLIRHLRWQSAPVDKYALLEQVWGYSPNAMSRTVTTTVSRLRGKIEADSRTPKHLLTQPEGYMLVGVRDITVHPWDAFVGRTALLRQLETCDAPLVAIIGPAGIGKTRLLREWIQRTPGDVLFVDLTACESPVEVVVTVSKALDLGADADAETVGRALAARGSLTLALDNLEQVPGAASLVRSWSEAAPGARLFATSQIRLEGVSMQIVVEPLSEVEATALLVQRGRRACPTLTDDVGAQAHLKKAAQLLEGLPLALELAASWLDLVEPAALVRRLEDAQGLLEPAELRSGRHASLHAALEHSWALLTPDLHGALQQVCLFEADFALSGAEPLLGTAAPLSLRALEARSWIQKRGRRFRMLASTRTFVRTRLSEDRLDRCREIQIQAWLRTDGALSDADAATVKAAVAWALDRKPALAGRLLRVYIERVGGADLLGPAWLDVLHRASGCVEGQDALWVRLFHARVMAYVRPPDARQLLEALSRRDDLPDDLAVRVHLALGMALTTLGDTGAPAALLTALSLAPTAGEPAHIARALSFLSRYRRHVQQFETSLELAIEARVAAEHVGDPNLLADVLGAEASAHVHASAPERARACLERAVLLPASESVLEVARMRLGAVLVKLGELDRARALLLEAAEASQRRGNLVSACATFYRLAESAVEASEHELALTWLARAEQAVRAGGLEREKFAVGLGFVTVHLDRGDAAAARAHLVPLLSSPTRTDGTSFWAYVRAGQVAHLQSHASAAEEAYKRALSFLPDGHPLTHTVRAWRGLARVRLGQCALADADVPTLDDTQGLSAEESRTVCCVLDHLAGRPVSEALADLDGRLVQRLDAVRGGAT